MRGEYFKIRKIVKMLKRGTAKKTNKPTRTKRRVTDYKVTIKKSTLCLYCSHKQLKIKVFKIPFIIT